jgi:hypothetical protein
MVGLATLIGCAACGDDVCGEAYEKRQACVEALNCNELGPMERPSCENTKSSLGQQERVPEALCVGEVKEAAEQYVDCTLDPRTCVCAGG